MICGLRGLGSIACFFGVFLVGDFLVYYMGKNYTYGQIEQNQKLLPCKVEESQQELRECAYIFDLCHDALEDYGDVDKRVSLYGEKDAQKIRNIIKIGSHKRLFLTFHFALCSMCIQNRYNITLQISTTILYLTVTILVYLTSA